MWIRVREIFLCLLLPHMRGGILVSPCALQSRACAILCAFLCFVCSSSLNFAPDGCCSAAVSRQTMLSEYHVQSSRGGHQGQGLHSDPSKGHARSKEVLFFIKAHAGLNCRAGPIPHRYLRDIRTASRVLSLSLLGLGTPMAQACISAVSAL